MEAGMASSQRAVGPSLEPVTSRPCTHLAFEASFPNLYPRSHVTALALSSPWCLCPELPSGSRHLSFLALHLSWRAVDMLEVLKQQGGLGAQWTTFQMITVWHQGSLNTWQNLLA